ncbi:hypothetical protein [Corynebacterium lizhenjunii]|nr:hypothetical protein [Corynebacterium lizhenjunii]
MVLAAQGYPAAPAKGPQLADAHAAAHAVLDQVAMPGFSTAMTLV